MRAKIISSPYAGVAIGTVGEIMESDLKGSSTIRIPFSKVALFGGQTLTDTGDFVFEKEEYELIPEDKIDKAKTKLQQLQKLVDELKEIIYG